MTKFAFYHFKYGILKIGYNNDYITCLCFVDNIDCLNEPDKVSDEALREINEYIDGKRKTFNLKIQTNGTEFQTKVWDVLSNIPYGETKTYKEVATLVGNSNASRAVGMACNKNNMVIAIPCHRVIGSAGKLVGYALGLKMKSELLELEQKFK